MKLREIAEKLELKPLTRDLYDKDVTGVYISVMVSDVIANAQATEYSFRFLARQGRK